MRLAIMQPYLFPYIGYFQLMKAADKFVVYDDVTFIKQGWINRNNILLNGQKHMFSLPVENVSSFKKINETGISEKLYLQWLKKFDKTLQVAYSKAPFYKMAYPVIKQILDHGASCYNVAELCKYSFKVLNHHFSINTEMVTTSAKYNNQSLQNAERVIDICKKENATTYVNAIGGQSLYSKEMFQNNGVKLRFLRTITVSYDQFNYPFIPYLSIIDVMMFNSGDSIGKHLNSYELV